MADYPVHACTDVTGFGLLGHLAEMVKGSGCGARLRAGEVPVVPEALEYAGMGLVPAGAHKNREFVRCMVDMDGSVDPVFQDLLYDPQTSGGLLICVDPARGDELLHALKSTGVPEAACIGEAVPGPEERIVVA